ncbi:WhiB family transcriptional regulator [Georgenia phoenicis]
MRIPSCSFPVGDARPALARVEEAKVACRQCPVIDACLSRALETRQDRRAGRGRSERERRNVRRRVARMRRGRRRPGLGRFGQVRAGALPLHSSQRCW